MKINLLAALVAVLFGVSYAAAADPADPISLMESDLGQATAELHSVTADGTPISLVGCGGCGCDKRWTAGVEATYLVPVFEANEFTIDDSNVSLDYDFEAAPRIWLGIENCDGLGVRARYWDFDAEASFQNLDIDTSDNADGVAATSLLEMYTIDVEGTKRFCKGGWDLLGSFGVRHAQIGYDSLTNEIDVSDGDVNDITIVGTSRQFDGTGVTAALEGSRAKCSGVSLYWNARGSVLWGDNKAAGADIDVDDNDIDTDTDAVRDEETLFIGEFQVGLEWRRHIKCVRADVFARGVFEAQWWMLDNNEQLDIGSVGGGNGDADLLGQGDLSLYGAAFSAGISR